jgi:hypothetical protein
MISILFDNSRLFDLSGSSLTGSNYSVRLNPSRIKEMGPYRKDKDVVKLIMRVSHELVASNKSLIVELAHEDFNLVHQFVKEFNHLDDIEILCLDQNEVKFFKKFDNSFKSYYHKECKKLHFDKSNENALIVDLDGTLAIKGPRGIFDESKVLLDTLNEPISDLVKILSKYYSVIYVTGRTELAKEDSWRWLEIYGLTFENSKLYCRKLGDHRPDDEVKESILKELSVNYNIELAIDDRLSVTKVYQKLGITTLNVNQRLLDY